MKTVLAVIGAEAVALVVAVALMMRADERREAQRKAAT